MAGPASDILRGNAGDSHLGNDLAGFLGGHHQPVQSPAARESGVREALVQTPSRSGPARLLGGAPQRKTKRPAEAATVASCLMFVISNPL